MIYEQLFPLAGGGALGFAVGYGLKKVIKFVIVGLGHVALLIGYLENQNWISANWTVIENQTSTMMTQAAHKAYAVTHAQQMGHEIPTGGVGLGVMGLHALLSPLATIQRS
jgi:uncharacterized membrane protein (Fun14 family)